MSPQYVNLPQAVSLFFKNYLNFSGRSTRSEYWWWVLTSFIINVVLALVFGQDSFITAIVELAVLIPSLALCFRRLHDVGKSGWWLLLAIVPLANFYLIYLYVKPSDGPNDYGMPAGGDQPYQPY